MPLFFPAGKLYHRSMTLKTLLFVCFTASIRTPLYSSMQRSLNITHVVSSALGEAANPDFCKNYIPSLPVLLLSKESKALHRNYNEASLGVTLSCNHCSSFTQG